MVTTVRVVIAGRVQGVWYRKWTVGEATRRGLSGWVRNLSDGRVEAVFSGVDEGVKAMVAACHDGPPAAEVRTVTIEPWIETLPTGFHQRPTV